MADISLIPGDTLWACACGERWVENGEGDQDMPAECGRCGGKMIVTGRLSEVRGSGEIAAPSTPSSPRVGSCDSTAA